MTAQPDINDEGLRGVRRRDSSERHSIREDGRTRYDYFLKTVNRRKEIELGIGV
jgi:hypothetical protein